MLNYFEYIAPVLPVIYGAVGIYYTRWLILGCSDGTWRVPATVGMGIFATSIYVSYTISESSIWIARFGISDIGFTLSTGMVAECLRALVGLAIIVRILGYTFKEETKSLFQGINRPLWLDAILIFTLAIISVYHFNPSFAASSLLAESSADLRSALSDRDSKLATGNSIDDWAKIAEQDALFAFPGVGSTPGTVELPYRVGDSFDVLRRKFQVNADLAEVQERLGNYELSLMRSSFQFTAEELKLLEAPEIVPDSEATNKEVRRASALAIALRKELLGRIFDDLFLESCVMPYAIYGVYSTLAFASIFVPLLWVPLVSIKEQWGRIEKSLSEIAKKAKERELQKLQKAFDASWKECFDFVSRYAELPLLIAAFLGIELAFASATLANAALKLTLIACLSLIILGVVALAASLIIEQALRNVKEAFDDENKYPDWFKGRNVRVFLDQVRNESFVGAVFGFASASLGLGVVIQILQFFQR